MTFGAPIFLLLGVVLVPLGVAGLRWYERQRHADLVRFGDPTLLHQSAALPDARARRRRDRWRLVALAFGLLALARPQWGREPVALPRTGRDVLVLLDLSRSMTVADGIPTRLDAAKRVVKHITAASPGDRLGLVVFGGSAFLQLPFTLDHAAFQAFLDAATTDDLGDPATDVAAALRTARIIFEHEGEPGPRAVLLVSDGESLGGDAAAEGQIVAAADQLREVNIPVLAVGVGSVAGGPIPADSAAAPERWHRDYIGRIVVSRLEEANLRVAAARTGGVYARWDAAPQLQALVARLTALDTRELSSAGTTQRTDRFQWPLAVAVVALLAEVVSLTLMRRRTTVATAVVAIGVLGCKPSGWRALQGERLYDDGQFRGAYGMFERAQASDSNPAWAYNTGNALYRLRRYEDAAKQFSAGAAGPEPWRLRSQFNLGNAYVRLAEEQQGAEQRRTLRRAVAVFEEVVRVAPNDTAAKWNLEVALRKLGDDGDGGGSPGRGNRGDYGRGDMDDPGYEGTEQTAVGAMAGGGYGSAEGESAEELSAAQARQLLEAVQREQLASHEGRQGRWGGRGQKDW